MKQTNFFLAQLKHLNKVRVVKLLFSQSTTNELMILFNNRANKQVKHFLKSKLKITYNFYANFIIQQCKKN